MPPSERPILCFVTDRRLARDPLEVVVAAAVAGGVDWVQLRERDLEGRALCELAERVIASARGAAARRGGTVRVLISRRVDVALAARADGVHLGWNALPVAHARSLLGDAALIGVATHAPGEVCEAAAAGADYVQLAPICAPLSKPPERAPLGIAALAALRELPIAARSAHPLRILAQGGIDAGNAAQMIRAGAAGIAVTGALLAGVDPLAAARTLRAQLDGAHR